jgi:hypothetical protein
MAIKLYHDKLPRIGVIFPTEFQGGKSYEPFLKSYSNDKFTLKIELKRGLATLTLISINGSATVIYKDLEFKIDQLKKLTTFTTPLTELEFVHTYWKGNTLMMAKVNFKNPKPVLIHGYEIIGPEGYSM